MAAVSPPTATNPTPNPTPVPTPDPAPTPPPAPVPVSSVPGWKTSEAWINLIVIIFGALPSSGLTTNSPTLTKIIGLIVAALSALNYTYQRSALKRSYYVAHTAYLAQSAAPRGRLPQLSATASLLVMLCAGALCMLPSCAEDCQNPQNTMSAKCIVSGSVVDCTGVSSLQTAVTVVEPIVVKLITSPSAQQPDGSINWPAIEQQIVNLALQYGACVVAEVWNDLMGNSPQALAVTGPRLSSNDLKKAFENIRARIAPGRTFIVGGGQKL
jgi:hypothetical protein